MMKKLAVALCFSLASGAALADVYVCLDKAGKKIFSDVACEKRGLQASIADFPVVTKDSVQPVYVVTPASASTQDAETPAKASQPSKTEKRASPWSSDLPLPRFALFFIALMPIAAALFLAFHLVLFIRARLRKYRHVRRSMEKPQS
ncbi:MAG: DUF4124 domain-containing protein [Pseudomonadota bacterium]